MNYYFDNYHINFPSLVKDYIIGKHNVKTISDFIDAYYDEEDHLLEVFPEYNDEGLRRALEDEVHEILVEIYDIVDIGI